MPRQRTPLGLTGQVFDRFLLALDPDRERAGQQYENLRASLIAFFRWRGITHPEDAADETLDRAAKRVAEGAQIENSALSAYVHGIAKNLCKEIARRPMSFLRSAFGTLRSAPGTVLDFQTNVDEGFSDERHECLSACIQSLPADAAWIVSFYDCDGRERIERRKSLAAGLNIAPNALRVRAHSIRQRLLGCVKNCLGVQTS